MGVPYPKTFPKWEPFQPANDNRPGNVWLPANDNKLKGSSMIPNTRRALREMTFADARLNFAVRVISLTWDYLEGDYDPNADIGQVGWPGGVPTEGFDLYADFGRVPHFGVAGVAGNGYAWPNVTLGTTFNYPFALAGYTGTPGVYDSSYVSEFQNASSSLDPNDYFSVWHYHALEDVSGWAYWRVSSSQTWVREAGGTNPIPSYIPAHDPFPAPIPTPVAKPMWRVRHDSKLFRDVFGNQVRGPEPLPRTHPNPEFPKPPGKHVKERKMALSITGVGSAIINLATESMDFVQAVYDALPEWLRKQLWKEHGGYMSPLDKAEALYKYANQIDLQKMLTNLLKESAEDRFYGQIGRLTAKANALRDSPGGLQLGPALEGVRFTVS